jgi:hypothetical protein
MPGFYRSLIWRATDPDLPARAGSPTRNQPQTFFEYASAIAIACLAQIHNAASDFRAAPESSGAVMPRCSPEMHRGRTNQRSNLRNADQTPD